MDSPARIKVSFLELRQFRCFPHLRLDFNAPYIVLEGDNGTGKTSILEALYYACYLRSFRTYSPRELIAFQQDNFFIKIGVEHADLTHEIQVGFSHNKRLVMVDQRAISSYKELMSYYRVMSLTEDDLDLIKGSPQHRRDFMDHLLLLIDPSYGLLLKEYRQIVDQRNALLQRPQLQGEMGVILTRQLWGHARQIEAKRRDLLEQLGHAIALLQKECTVSPSNLTLTYSPKLSALVPFEQFFEESLATQELERRYKRTLLGAHLDDVSIQVHQRFSRLFSSRGQQKFIVLLLKMAQLRLLSDRGFSTIFLLDDFMTDFDEMSVQELLLVLEKIQGQLIFTSPMQGGVLAQALKGKGGHVLKLTR